MEEERERRMSAAVIRRDEKGRFAKRVKRRKDSVFRQVTAKEIDTFFDALAASCNVSHAARESGIKPRNAYRLRQYDAGFRARWDAALAEGFVTLELEMLHRARFGVKTTTVESDEARVRKRVVKHQYSDNVAMALLSRHEASVARHRAAQAAAGAAEEDAARGLEKLRAMLAGIESGDAGAGRAA